MLTGRAARLGIEPDLPDVEVLVTDVAGNEQTMVTDPSGDATTQVAPARLTWW
ncbi:MAG: hypothetical protein R3F53_21605 [Gammaproteobacteria bacterium]